MTVVTDGIEPVVSPNMWIGAMFSIKDDFDEDEYGEYLPDDSVYSPLPYKYGEIDGEHWLKYGVVTEK